MFWFLWPWMAGMMAVFAVFAVITFIAWIWALVDCIKRPDKKFKYANKLIWILIIILLSWIGIILYYLLELRK